MSALKLETGDGCIFEMDCDALHLSELLCYMVDLGIGEDDEDEVLPLHNVGKNAMARILEYCHHHKVE